MQTACYGSVRTCELSSPRDPSLSHLSRYSLRLLIMITLMPSALLSDTFHICPMPYD